MDLPVASEWYQSEALAPGLWCITEPHVHPIFSANIFLKLGRDADIVIDSGMGIAPLRPLVDRLRPDRAKPVLCLATHAHVDHVGAAHEFEQRLVHPLEADLLADPEPYTLRSTDIPPALIEVFDRAGYPPLWPWLIDAIPQAGYDPLTYRMVPAPATGLLVDGNVIDLGDWQAEVLHLPGHSVGQIGLWHAESGTLFGADAVYDGPLIFDAPGMDVAAYTATLKRLRGLPVERVYGGHDPSFDRARLHRMIDHYLTLWGTG